MSRLQQRFYLAYIADPHRNATKAAITAGYKESGASARAHECLRNSRIASCISRTDAKVAIKAETAPAIVEHRAIIGRERVLEEYARLAFSTITDFMSFDGDHVTFKLDKATPSQLAAISEITVDHYKEPGEDGKQVVKFRIKMHDKLRALEKIATHVGLFKGEGDDGPDAFKEAFREMLVGVIARRSSVRIRPSVDGNL